MTVKGVLDTVGGFVVEVTVAMHTKVLPCSCGTDSGHDTVEWRWRLVRMLSSMERATLWVSTVVVPVELVEEDEPQALNSAVQASAASTTTGPRRARRRRAAVGVGDWMCMGA